jgi:hypothetical protein
MYHDREQQKRINIKDCMDNLNMTKSKVITALKCLENRKFPTILKFSSHYYAFIEGLVRPKGRGYEFRINSSVSQSRSTIVENQETELTVTSTTSKRVCYFITSISKYVKMMSLIFCSI